MWPGSAQAQETRNSRREVRETVAQVANERMSPSNDIGRGNLLEPAHRIQPLFEMAVVALHAIVEILRRPMLNAG